MHRARSKSLTLVAALIAGCGGPTSAGSSGTRAATYDPFLEPAPVAPRPRAAVVVVFDQLGSDTLMREFPHLDEDGAIRLVAARGTYVERVEYAFAATFTAPGHVAIYTGASPRHSGIGSNRVYDRARKRDVAVFDDGVHGVHDHPGAFASPLRLLVETVADLIRRDRPRAVVASVAMKARAAIAPAGQHPDHCYWFDPHAGGFTTSRWYAAELPAWVAAFRTTHPVERTLPPWEPLDAAALEARLGPDEQAGEGAFGLDSTFPHEAFPIASHAGYEAIFAHPASVELQLDFVDVLVDQVGIGADDDVDLLAVSIASTDLAGHGFGPDSHEYADALRRADRAVGAFLRALEARIGPVAIVITSDHGVAPLPERTRDRGGRTSSRVDVDVELALLQAALEEELGLRDAALSWQAPYVYLDRTLPGPEYGRVLATTRRFLSSRPTLALAVDAVAIAGSEVPPEPLAASVALAIPRPAPGDVYAMPNDHAPAVEDMPLGHGTSHGSYWAYDREVPLLFTSAMNRSLGTKLPQCVVASTIAALAGVDAPSHACTATELTAGPRVRPVSTRSVRR